MTRKEEILTHAPIGQWVSKTNLMSDYIGDLDNLDSSFRNYDSDANKSHDSSIVDAINHAWDTIDSINQTLASGVLTLKQVIADSSTFRVIRAGMLVADSATIDSAYVKDLTVTGILDVDSAYFDTITIKRLTVESDGNTFIDSAVVNRLNANFLLTDSAHINTLSAGSIVADSATIDSSTIGNLTIDSSFNFDDKLFTHSHLLTIKNEAGTIVYSGYVLSTDSAIGTP